MSAVSAGSFTHLGFLTILHDTTGYVGGYLVTNLWGRPLEFRLSTAVQPNRIQQVLYAHTLSEYVCGEVIGKTLFEKTGISADLVLTDCYEALALRRAIERPVVWLTTANDPRASDLPILRPAASGRGPVCLHPDFAIDGPRIKEPFERLAGLDLNEPFARIREAIAEARKMGVTQRAA